MITWNIRPICKARGIEKPYTFLVKAGLSPHSATAILNSDSRAIRLDHLELLCKILFCEPGDLFHWTPDKNNPLPERHPLTKLRKTPLKIDLTEAIRTLPLDKLNQINDLLSHPSDS
ncbi:MAG: helix-turn-helix transcriptional regulator [Bacteroidetes bacterium]|nr:helix-turn-helix transcriptional regulator [Bacteroidota bacterium]